MMRDYNQLRAYLAALGDLEDQLDAINTAKGVLFREAKACGFNRPIVKDLLRMRRAGKLHDLDVPAAFEGLVEAKRMSYKTRPKE